MKKYFILALPVLALAFGANIAFAQNQVIKQLSKEDRQILEQERKAFEEKNQPKPEKINGEILVKIKQNKPAEINFNQRVNVQALVPVEENKAAQVGLYRLDLDSQKDYSLVNQQNYTPTDKKVISYDWNDFLGKASYKIYVKLNDEIKDDKHLLIFVEPIVEKDLKTGKALEPTVPYAYIVFSKDGKNIRLGGHVYPIDDSVSGRGFNKQIAVEK